VSDPSLKKTRARDLGVPFEGTPGPFNAITDVAGVEVGHTTLISGDGPLVVGQGPIRTGVTGILPRGNASFLPVFGGWFSLNGNGEMTGTAWLEEAGVLDGPVMITNTHSVGTVRDAVIAWQVERGRMPHAFSLPVVAETCDARLNDINGFHVRPEHVFQALDGAKSGFVAEGNVGGGTGMIAHEFKGGIGTASRVDPETGYTVGVLVQANHGMRHQLRVGGVLVGPDLTEALLGGPESGSIIIVVATDAPLLPHQCRALAKRSALGMARTGSVAGLGSGDIMVAFATGNLSEERPLKPMQISMIGLHQITPLFEATIQATEEAITNALVAAETMTGINGRTLTALPHDTLRAILRKYNRLVE
jgi:L-aminopeptidase/D-esterase-like protein